MYLMREWGQYKVIVTTRKAINGQRGVKFHRTEVSNPESVPMGQTYYESHWSLEQFFQCYSL